ncbi:MAG: methyltransferase [Candidatus Micrarchaeota archaeon]|nr:methyltransferase [Candidatus Micrarchaeota archaeon]
MMIPEILKKLKRGPQVILPKDAGIIVAFTGVGKKSIVVDAGAGSGWLAVFLGNICKKVVSYERREDFAKLARENVKRAELRNVKIKENDVFEGIDEREVDLVTLDMGDSHLAVPHAYAALKTGGHVFGYLPHAEQVTRFKTECERVGFREIRTFECIVREMLVRESGFRPDTTGLWHTAYLVFARK